MAPKTRVEIQRAYWQRQKEQQQTVPKVWKTRAEIQKAYRERQKEKNSNFKKKNERKKECLYPNSLAGWRSSRVQEKKNRVYAKRFRDRKKRLPNRDHQESDSDESSHPKIKMVNGLSWNLILNEWGVEKE